MRKINLLFLLIVLTVGFSWSQVHHGGYGSDGRHHAEFKKFRIALLIGHTSVPSGNRPEHFFIPSWGLDVEYWFERQWGIGFHNDLELHTFIIGETHKELLEREYPLVTTIDLLYKPWKELVLLAGPGFEFEKNEDFHLVRFGVEYEFELPGDWDLSPVLFYDTRFDAFDTWSIALGVGKRF